MKKILVISLALCTFMISSCKKQTYSYQEYGLNCPVKSVIVKTYEAESVFGEITKGELNYEGHYKAEFNDVGNILSFTVYDDDGYISEVTKYKYNENNNIVEKTTYDYDGEIDNVTKYVYNEDHNVIDCSTYYGTGDLNCQYLYEYDKKLLSNITYIKANVYRIESGKCFTKGAKTQSVTEIKRDGKTITEEIEYKSGKLSSILKYNRNDKSGYESVEYDNDGHVLFQYLQIKNNHKTTFRKFLKEDILCEIIWDDKNMPIYLKNAELSENSNHIVQYGSSDESIYHIEYEYDKKHNWIKQIVYEGERKVPLKISERTIHYK